MPETKNDLYAIGTAKGRFVELRYAKKPPKISRSVLVKNVPVLIHDGYDECAATDEGAIPINNWWRGATAPQRYHRHVREFEDRIERVRLISVKGGRRIWPPLSRQKFISWTGHSLGDGVIWPIPRKMSDKLLARLRAERRAGPKAARPERSVRESS